MVPPWCLPLGHVSGEVRNQLEKICDVEGAPQRHRVFRVQLGITGISNGQMNLDGHEK